MKPVGLRESKFGMKPVGLRECKFGMNPVGLRQTEFRNASNISKVEIFNGQELR